jgi:uncharacterized protein (TIGR02598 family)
MIVRSFPIRSHSSPGFSLVEVALAVAIAAVGIITLLGLMPEGLEMSRKTGLLTLNSNIVEQIIRDLENTQFRLLPTQGTGSGSGGGTVIQQRSRRYFDDQGQQVGEDSNAIIFVAEIDFSQPAALPKTEQQQPNLRRVIIRVANTGNPAFEFNPDNQIAYTTYNHLLARTR